MPGQLRTQRLALKRRVTQITADSLLAGLYLLVGALLCHDLASAQPVGDAARGQRVYEQRCGGCHAVDADRVGPRHAGVLGRLAGSVPGFAYSPALAGSGIRWDRATLEAWLGNPEALVPGQRMGYRLADVQPRADVIAYLSTLKAVSH
ncbi:c-type cytochrome [Paucibacter sp. APW11]|uniref:C-type cytochrome n=1 Tax=Roseateles aquae TaxID=3077235 RepID=A0ABU3PDW1_9BURK|nr:c-type cytochrome [Paucibacter sp. APW11]MDT9000746.1 c-type cytochrome [Paucibacter sp. APW11]